MRAGTDVMRYSGWLSNEAMKLDNEIKQFLPHSGEIREILSGGLRERKWMRPSACSRLFTQTAERISASAGRCLSTADAAFRIREVLQLAMER